MLDRQNLQFATFSRALFHHIRLCSNLLKRYSETLIEHMSSDLMLLSFCVIDKPSVVISCPMGVNCHSL